MWPSVHPIHPPSSHPSISPASASISHPHSLAAPVSIRSHLAHHILSYSLSSSLSLSPLPLLLLCFAAASVKGTNRPAAAQRQTNCCVETWPADVATATELEPTPARSYENPLLRVPPPPQEHVPPHSSTFVRFPDRAGSTLGTEVSRRYTQTDCRSEATQLPADSPCLTRRSPSPSKLRPADRTSGGGRMARLSRF